MNSNKKKADDIYTYLKFRGDLDFKMWMTESRKTVVNAIKSEESSWKIPEFNIRKKSEF